MPRSDYDYLQQHPLSSIINIHWGSIRFIAFSLQIDRRPTLEWLSEPIGSDNGLAVSRGGQTNDYVNLGLVSPPPFDWNLMLTKFRYCWSLVPTYWTFDGGLILSVQDDPLRADRPIELYQSNGDMNTDGGTLWSLLAFDQVEDFAITGLPALPKTITQSNVAAAFNNASVFFQGARWFAPQMEWEELEGGPHASGLSAPQFLEGGELVYFQNASSVTFQTRGIGMTGGGITDIPVGFDSDGGPVPGGPAQPDPRDHYTTIFGEEDVSLTAMSIIFKGEPWRVVAAVHEPTSRPDIMPSYIMNPVGIMWCLAVRESDPEF